MVPGNAKCKRLCFINFKLCLTCQSWFMDCYGRCPLGFHHRMSLAPAVDIHKNVASCPGVVLCLILSESWTLHIVVGEKRLLVDRNNLIVYEFQALSCRIENIFWFSLQLESIEGTQHLTEHTMSNCKRIFINESSQPEVNVETYCQWTSRIFLRYLLWLIWSLSACL